VRSFFIISNNREFINGALGLMPLHAKMETLKGKFSEDDVIRLAKEIFYEYNSIHENNRQAWEKRKAENYKHFMKTWGCYGNLRKFINKNVSKDERIPRESNLKMQHLLSIADFDLAKNRIEELFPEKERNKALYELLLKHGKYNELIEILEIRTNQEKKHVSDFLEYFKWLLRMEKDEAAIQKLEEFIDEWPYSIFPHKALFDYYMNKEIYDKAHFILDRMESMIRNKEKKEWEVKEYEYKMLRKARERFNCIEEQL